MACLRTARAHGHLELSNIMSSGLVSTECIKQGLVHQHSQVKGQQFMYPLNNSNRFDPDYCVSVVLKQRCHHRCQ